MRPKSHNERCQNCKETIESLLVAIYGEVKVEYDLGLPSRIEEYSGSRIYNNLFQVYRALQNYRGYDAFVRTKRLPRVDFFIPDQELIIEFDESQHFTKPREIALTLYPDEQEFGFAVDRWRSLCQDLKKQDNYPPDRDEQRAWYDTLRDFAPFLQGTGKTVRLFSRDFIWCSLNPKEKCDVKKFREIIGGKPA